MRLFRSHPASPAASSIISSCGIRVNNLRTRCQASRPGLVGMQLIGVGSSAPATIVSNDDLAKLVDTNDEWIATRTGIKRRHVLAKGEKLSDLAKEASSKALEMAGLRADEIDLILYATSSPDDLFGGACQVGEAMHVPAVSSAPVNQ